jgi:hypothetical protein
MATDQGPVVQSARLRSELVRLRRGSGLAQEEVAENLEWSSSKIIRMEDVPRSCGNDFEQSLAQFYFIIKSWLKEFRTSSRFISKRSRTVDRRGHIINFASKASIRNESRKVLLNYPSGQDRSLLEFSLFCAAN